MKRLKIKNWFKRTAALALAVMMTVSAVPVDVFAQAVEAGVHSHAEEAEPLAGKKLSVLGASISTYEGTSNGKAADTTNSTIRNNVKYYPNSTIPEVTLNDTWWMQVTDDLGLELLVNNAWSGSAILLERAGTVGAYVDRCVQLHDNTGDNAGEEPDIICIQMGFNDFSYGKSTLGTADIDYDKLITANGYGTPTTTMEATAIMLDKMVKRYPDAEIYMFNHFKRIGQSSSDTKLMEQLNESIQTVCDRFGVSVVDLYTVLTESEYIGDGKLHPNKLGMDVITEAVKQTIVEHTAYSVKTHTVSFELENVSADYGTDRIVVDGDEFHVNLTAEVGNQLSVEVFMGGKDVTDTAYSGGTVTIPSVTGDVVITAKSVHEPKSYRWEFNGTELSCVGGNNALTKNAGTTSDGVFNKTRYALEHNVVLKHDLPWIVEWKSEGTWKNTSGSGGRMFTSDDVNAHYNARYIFKSSVDGLIAMGEKTTSGSHNYGIALADHGIDASELHTYRLENRIENDGTNMIYLLVDGKEIGPMVNYHVGTTDKNTTSNWLSGKDFVFPYMGTDSHGLTNCKIEYIQVWEEVQPLNLTYDDHYDITGKTVEIIDAGTPTSYQVGYGVEENTVRDTRVVSLEGDAMVATGVGTATVKIDGELYEVTVEAAPISLILLAGQSNMQGNEGNKNQSIVCPDGQVYATYGASGTMNASNASNFAASALTGEYSSVNVNGTTNHLSGYPIYTLNEEGAGKEGADSGFAYEWVNQTGEKIWVVNAAHGGSAISTWLKGGANYNEATALFSACQETLRKEIKAGHFTLSHMGYFWCQGCADETQTAEWYVDKYLTMHEELKNTFKKDMDSDPSTPDVTLEFGGIIPIRSGHQGADSYRAGTYTDTTTAKYFESFKDLRMNGPRVAQYWMGNNPELTDIWNVCTIQEEWATMPDGTDGVEAYFQAHYTNGKVDYKPQVAQSTSWYMPKTPAAVHDSIHYNQIGYNEIGRESARNALIYLEEIDAPNEKTTVKFVGWDGFTTVDEVVSSTVGNSGTLVVPMVSPVWKSKDVTYHVSENLTYDYYDLLSDEVNGTGTLNAKISGSDTITVSPRELAQYRWNFDGLSAVSETTDGFTKNTLKKLSGTLTNGMITNGRYQMEQPVVLLHDQPWLVEWKMAGDWSGMLLSTSATSNTTGNNFLFKTTGNTGFIGIGEPSGSLYNNYGVTIKSLGLDMTVDHVYRAENRIEQDGSNMVYLSIDGNLVGALNNYFIGGTNDQKKKVDWVSGKDFVFSYVGASGHPLQKCNISYIVVDENGHEHSYEAVTTTPTCTEQGYTIYTCSLCGDSYRTPWLDKTAYEGMTIACVGDSITAGVGVTKDENDYVKVLADQLGMNYIRLGVSGTTLCTDGPRTCNITRLTESYLNGADIVTIALGINDFCAATAGCYELGDIDSTDSSTIYGAARMWCERIEELRETDSLRDTQFYFVTPVIASWNNSVTNQRNWDQSKTNIHGYTLRDLCNAIIEVATLYDVEVIDLNLVSGMYYVNSQDNNITEFGGDGVHPGVKGHEMMATAMANALLQNNLRDDHVHTFGSWITTTWPSCNDGEQQRVCSVCSAVESRTIEPNRDHTYENGVCTVCGTVYSNLTNYKGKVISVLGDSISTFAGYIPVADGFNLEHLPRYPQDNLVTDVNETWWMQVINELDARLGINDSWRGATVSGAASVTSGVAGEKASMANLTRIQNLGSNGTPDVILFYGGTNDLAHVSKVGIFDASTAPTAVDLTTAKWDNLADGYVHTLLRLKHYYPDAEIVAMLPTYTASYYTTTKLAEANSVLAEICEHYGVAYVDLRDCGISAADLPDGIHPGAKGMDYITDAVIETLLNECEVEAGDHVVHSIKHNLTNVSATLGHWKGISSGDRFVETLIGDGSLTVDVTMGGEDITSAVYKNGTITIPAVTGDLVINAKTRFSLGSHLQQLPEEFCSGVNLWTELEHDKYYYTEKDGWGINSLGTVYSITFPVEEGDRIYASSFGKAGTNGYASLNGIRCTFFGEDGVLKAMAPVAVYAEFSANGYLTAPAGAVAVNVPMWTNSDAWEVKILNRGHQYENGVCSVCGAEHPNLDTFDGKVISILSASTSTYAGYIPVADGFNLEHRARYPQSNLLTDVNDTWWMQVINGLDAKLGINDSWAGSQVLNTRDTNSGDLGPDAAMASLTRIQNLGSNGTPDLILFFGGGNDMGRGVKLGTFDSDTAPEKVDLTTTKWGSFAEAYVAAIMRLQYFYPETEIIAMTSYPMPSYVTAKKLDTYGPVIKVICDHYGVKYLDLRDCGVTFDMLPDNIHPNAEGMDYITEAVIARLLDDVELESGEHVVHSVTHKLTNVKASLGHWKGISSGTKFVETLRGTGNLDVSVSMGGKDITATAYADGIVTIPEVTGDVVIAAKGSFTADGHLQRLPEELCAGTNIWTVLEPENIYYTVNGWGLFSNQPNVHSVTFPVEEGERIWATSFGSTSINGMSANGTRITWFDETGVLETVARNVAYAEFAKNGYITVPEGASSVNIPMNDASEDWEIYLLDREHDYGKWVEVTAPTCTVKGQESRDCANCDKFEVRDVNALDHVLKKYSAKAATCTEKGWNAYETCSRCDYTTYKEIPEKGHTVVVDKAVSATCEKNGLTEGSHCSVCQAVLKKQEVVSATGHKYGVWTQIKAPTCTTKGQERRDCANCDKHEVRDVAALGHDLISHAGKNVTCIENGWEAYETCTRCDYTTYKELPAKGHTVVVDKSVSATCEKTGLTEGSHCSVCQTVLKKQEVVSATGHKYGVWTQTKAPTYTEMGEERRDCDNCDYYEVRNIDVLTEEAMPPAGGGGGGLIEEEVMEEPEAIEPIIPEEPIVSENPFDDVKEENYFFEPVMWALNNMVTSGTTADTFSPGATCTRAQTVTFLWNAAGKPEPKTTECPFVDVSPTSYYYKAVLWAVEEGITSGVSANSFGPNKTVTRGQTVTFLWKFAGLPDVKKESKFDDVIKTNYYHDAVVWALEEEITSGTSEVTFSPNQPCTRGQIVTFLYRYIVE